MREVRHLALGPVRRRRRRAGRLRRPSRRAARARCGSASCTLSVSSRAPAAISRAEVRVLPPGARRARHGDGHHVAAQLPRRPSGSANELDDRPEPALEHRLVERLLAGEVVVEARRRKARARAPGRAPRRRRRRARRRAPRQRRGSLRASAASVPRRSPTPPVGPLGHSSSRAIAKQTFVRQAPGRSRHKGPPGF